MRHFKVLDHCVQKRFKSEGGFSSLMRHSALKHTVILKNHFKVTSFKSLLKTQEDFCSQLALWVMVGHIYDPVIIMTCFKKSITKTINNLTQPLCVTSNYLARVCVKLLNLIDLVSGRSVAVCSYGMKLNSLAFIQH